MASDKATETYGERVAQNRRECFPPITAEEDAEIARRTGRARKIERCARCGRNMRLEYGCWFCARLGMQQP